MSRKKQLLIAKGRNMTEAKAKQIIRNYYRNDPDGYASDLAITKKRGESLIQWAEQLLDPI